MQYTSIGGSSDLFSHLQAHFEAANPNAWADRGSLLTRSEVSEGRPRNAVHDASPARVDSRAIACSKIANENRHAIRHAYADCRTRGPAAVPKNERVGRLLPQRRYGPLGHNHRAPVDLSHLIKKGSLEGERLRHKRL